MDYDRMRNDADTGQLRLGIMGSAGQVVFDHKAAWEAKQRGTKLAAEHLVQWKHRADQWLNLRRDSGDYEFTADDLVNDIGLPSAEDGTPTNNGVGGYISALAKNGEIHPVGYTTSDRVSNHSRVLRRWRIITVFA